jgi:hypothetical protein
MKRVVLSIISLALFFIYIFSENSFAQEFKLKIEAMSPGKLNLKSSATTWFVSSGLPNIARGMKAYLNADTSGDGVSYSWSITSKPDGSNAVLDSIGTKINSFTADVVGDYTISVTVGSKTLSQNIYAGIYNGSSLTKNCAPCHVLNAEYDKFASWKETPHATIYMRGITGQLEVNSFGDGTYGTSCTRCHTTGWEPDADNGNFGFLAKQSGWDTTWYKPLPAGSSFEIPNGDMTRWDLLNNSYSALLPVATIGCESCHGPSKEHALTVEKEKTAVSLDGGVCNQCHDAPTHHNIGSYWAASNHATLVNSSAEAGNKNCYPCHSGAAFVKYSKNQATPGYNVAQDNFPSISCATCHDPHVEANLGIRIMTLSSLANGYKPPEGVGGMGLLCMNCHHARDNGKTMIANQEKKFSSRFYPHHSPQGDMFLGSNGYEYDQNLEGLGTHQGLPNGCVTCHMQARNASDTQSNHQLNMEDENGNDIVTSCKTCHGSNIQSFEDVKAFYDYDGNGKIEGAMVEVENLLAKLKEILPKDASGEVVTNAQDSMIVKNDPRYPDILKAMYNYQFVKEDKSNGAHNTKYAVALLKASFGSITGVETRDTEIPMTFDLKQNFPNPFNPTTQIQFSVPVTAHVTMNIYDALGRLVNTLVNGELIAGNYNVTWNGKNNYGSQCASGIYFYQMLTKTENGQSSSVTKKMVLTK